LRTPRRVALLPGSFTEALAALEVEWLDIVREHGDLSTLPYDLERDTRHEVRLRRYKESWEHLIATLVETHHAASDNDTPMLMFQ
jgi:hypothetical protein